MNGYLKVVHVSTYSLFDILIVVEPGECFFISHLSTLGRGFVREMYTAKAL